jgi:hypothetical protein
MRRNLIALATAATLAVSAATPARADGGATAAWIIGGIAVAGLIAATTYPGPAYAYYGPAPVYYGPYAYVPGPRCYWSTAWGPWGPYQARVCY